MLNTMQKKYLSLAALALMAVSCNNELSTDGDSNENVKKISATITDFKDGEAGTRASYSVSETAGILSSWTAGDVLGIYPVGGDQVSFPISDGAGSQTAQFDGGKWALRANADYAAYYPFSKANYMIDQTEIPVKYQTLTQYENGSLSHLTDNDFMAAAATRPDASGNVNLPMKHLGAFVRVQLTIPTAGTFKNITISSNNGKFTTAGTVDLTAETPAITATSTSSSVSLNLDNISTTSSDEVLTAYLMVAPADMSEADLTFYVTRTDDLTLTYTQKGKNILASNAYSFSPKLIGGSAATFVDPGTDENGNAYVDLGLPSGTLWATCNLGALSPEEYGDYYAWGETETYYSVLDPLTWKTGKEKGYHFNSYKWCNGTTTSFTKYVTDSNYGLDGFTDGKTVLESSDDAATAKLDTPWRMPSDAEWEELASNCTRELTTVNGNSCIKVTSTINNNYILLPEAGSFQWTSISIKNMASLYWSNSIDEKNQYNAHLFNVRQYKIAGTYRYYGHPIRPVRNK